MKRGLIIILGLAILALGIIEWKGKTANKEKSTPQAMEVNQVQFVNSTISADGLVAAQSQVKLAFQTGGKLVYLPFKEGDSVKKGQTIAKLDSYALQKQLTMALNNYKTTRDNFDQTSQNADNNVLKSQITSTYTKATDNVSNVIDEAAKRIMDQSQMSLDNSVLNVELANYALQLSTLNSPISGILTHADVTVTGVNVTPAATFTIADPETMVFRANVPASSIYYIAVGNEVSLAIDGLPEKITGVVDKIYPTKVVLSSGQSIYQVDISSPDLKSAVRLDQGGKAMIVTHSENVALVPAWLVLNGKYIWTEEGQGGMQMKEVEVGKIHGNQIEITAGLSANDRLIVDPEYIKGSEYKLF